MVPIASVSSNPWQRSEQCPPCDAERLLLHHVVQHVPVRLGHPAELVSAADAAVAQHQGAVRNGQQRAQQSFAVTTQQQAPGDSRRGARNEVRLMSGVGDGSLGGITEAYDRYAGEER